MSDALPSGGIKVTVDLALCEGHAACQEVAPEVFEVRDDGFAHILLPVVVDPETIEKVQDAISLCPVDAIRIEQA